MTIAIVFRKDELATKLYPNSISVSSAKQQLRKEINDTEGLKEAMQAFGRMRKQTFTRKQVGLLLERFDLTFEDIQS